MEKGKAYWGRKAVYSLLKDSNWAIASLEVFQGILGKKEDRLLKAVTGLAGGVVNAGSTCGIVSGGAMGLALSHYEEIMEKGLPAQVGLFAKIGEYIHWFEEKYGSSLCRESSGVDFYKAMGLLRYMVPGDKLI